MTQALDRDIEAQVEQLGFELVELERAGSRTRPILRLRIDRPQGPDGEVAAGVDLGDCARVSRALELYLEERGDVPSRYVLEVSSPGIERPLTKPRDYRRFAGERVAVLGAGPLIDGAKRVEGELLGLSNDEGVVLIRADGGAELAIEREKIKRVHLVYRWRGEGREG
jgi:ribosome maturation factor RimP